MGNVSSVPGVFGSDPVGVLECLVARRRGKPVDGAKVGLVFEGGSMRGIYGSGVAHVFNQIGLTESFDLLIGTSSGALNAIYFPGQNQELGATIYYENAVDKRCLNILNFPDILNVQWLMDEWVLKQKRFNDRAVFDGSHDIFISSTNIDSGKTRWFQNDSRVSFEKAIIATTCTPTACSQTIEIEGEFYNDGFINASLPIDKAIEEGCTHIVVVPTRIWGHREPIPNPFWTSYFMWMIRNFGKEYKKAFFRRHDVYNRQLELAAGGGDRYKTLVVAPISSRELVGRLESNGATIKAAWQTAVKNTFDKMSGLKGLMDSRS